MARRRVVLGLAVALALGVAVYLRLWTIDYSFSAGDAELIRKEFDLAHREAMDESAEWRRMYDEELERANRCKAELRELKESFSNKAGDSALSNSKLVMLQKVTLSAYHVNWCHISVLSHWQIIQFLSSSVFTTTRFQIRMQP
ncbi:hypothetical protein EUGRSUZ_K03249 [Eucalyptus grandis]|uniref:Uncharacterized protein n=2 Tax=Eucalyptus grandis TaxID=71139 RepID=A0ACC3IZ45_EUCGR|nr:hypothetical protein EUGRSUZ_K03249 [Eucalyptus grandis]